MQSDKDNYRTDEDLFVHSELGPLVLAWIAAFNAHDVKQIASFYTQDAELFDSGMKRARRGRDEIIGWFTQRFQKMPAIQYMPTHSFFNAQEAVVCWIASGNTPVLLGQRWLSHPFEVEGVSIFRIQAGSIQWQHGYYDHLQIVERVLPPLRWLPLKL
ncbi:nuclear transport factor 2 family protein [Dictyobacter arantiisoli]|uniref:SnoaL-like domain-containing protein n=1 Tax=Dictyobacter arantiisoli TaxID=2014874 RepID=A0A5A5TIK8_9CHLR|nr:nuclear transport factor 2 family protein [Dictyobacter arantiisoli]GCF11162.1 hypothetical protein KDI_47260 [Dictyobacter arantiisoli]